MNFLFTVPIFIAAAVGARRDPHLTGGASTAQLWRAASLYRLMFALLVCRYRAGAPIRMKCVWTRLNLAVFDIDGVKLRPVVMSAESVRITDFDCRWFLAAAQHDGASQTNAVLRAVNEICRVAAQVEEGTNAKSQGASATENA